MGTRRPEMNNRKCRRSRLTCQAIEQGNINSVILNTAYGTRTDYQRESKGINNEEPGNRGQRRRVYSQQSYQNRSPNLLTIARRNPSRLVCGAFVVGGLIMAMVFDTGFQSCTHKRLAVSPLVSMILRRTASAAAKLNLHTVETGPNQHQNREHLSEADRTKFGLACV